MKIFRILLITMYFCFINKNAFMTQTDSSSPKKLTPSITKQANEESSRKSVCKKLFKNKKLKKRAIHLICLVLYLQILRLMPKKNAYAKLMRNLSSIYLLFYLIDIDIYDLVIDSLDEIDKEI